jgi:hypothetical protein
MRARLVAADVLLDELREQAEAAWEEGRAFDAKAAAARRKK